MVDSATPKPTPANFPSLDALARLPAWAVALSGGADSTALLIASALRWPGKTHAIHVHHGLQAAADGFAAHCETLCQQFAVPLVVVRVQAAHQSGESPEVAARQARYQAFSQALQLNWSGAVQHVVLGQHADDQVETLLLALSRGAGLPGLASMPSLATRQGVTYHRPWLDVPGATLRKALMEIGQTWMEDPTNHARQTNVLRHWLAQENMQASAAQMEALLVQVKSCTTRGHDIHIKVGRGFVKREGAVLRCYN